MVLSPSRPSGYLSFTLHAHLPYVVNHGTWPHGIDWLHEAAAETYLPLLRVLANLERDGIALRCNLNLTPVLMEQLLHPGFQSEFPKYLERKVASAREDESYFATTGEQHFSELARYWQKFFAMALEEFEALGRDIVSGFRRFHEAGMIEIITTGATHGYLPLLGTDESVRAQVRTAVATYERHIGHKPRGLWSPECGYRPAGIWEYPVASTDGSPIAPPFERAGLEQVFRESGLNFFLVDSHLIEHGIRTYVPDEPALGSPEQQDEAAQRSFYHPYIVNNASMNDNPLTTTVFPRDPRTGLQVWSGEHGYPGDASYLDFHKKRWPGGHRYWRVTGPRVDMGAKEPYFLEQAAERIQSHASHFVHLVWEALEPGFGDSTPPILSAPFDAELFGHWWFEGPQWLEAVARILHRYPMGVELISGSQYLEQYPSAGFISMQEGSWGSEGNSQAWLNEETSWTWSQIYPAEIFLREVCSGTEWQADALSQRIVKQMCRELLLLESSDWQFLITTGAARDYAQLRFDTHRDQFEELKAMWLTLHPGQESGAEHSALSEEQLSRLQAIETRDNIFQDVDPSFWAVGSHATSDSEEAVDETAIQDDASLSEV